MNRSSKIWLFSVGLFILIPLATTGFRTQSARMAALCPKSLPKITFENLSPPYKNHCYFQHHELVPFDYDASSFSWINAWWLAEASTLVYADKAFCLQWFEKIGLKHVKFFSASGTHCVIAANDDFAIVAFRGSEIWKRNDRFEFQQILADLKTNLDIRLRRWDGGGKVHHGFMKALEVVWDEMMPEINRLRDKGLKIWITGHSLGAALATLAADRLQFAQGAYTFGSPRVGDKTFQARFHGQIFRIVNGKDIVPTVPAKNPFQHVGTLIHINPETGCNNRPDSDTRSDDGACPCSKEAAEDSQAQSSLKIDPAVFIPDAVRDHVPLLYSILLWNKITGNKAPGKLD